ncbi:MAG: hypothetical protein AABZ65_04330 [Candidatus Omnitrophota bacterium]
MLAKGKGGIDMSLKYTKLEKVSLKDYYDEKWLQSIIEEDPGLIGLGDDVVIIAKEKKQSTGGRIDFLLNDPETETMYEVEVQLGATDESHIIRTIEYWDIERRRFPSKDHKAVIIAEEITNRFFNVIALMNRSIPIIAIQLNAVKIEDKISLNFTKVLDIYEEPEDEENLGGDVVDRGYWENRSNQKSIDLVDELVTLTKEIYDSPRVTYNKHHIALGTQRKNFAWFHPRKKEGYCYFDIRVGKENIAKVKGIFEEAGIPFNPKKEDIFGIPLQASVFKNNKTIIAKLFQDACALNK